MKTFLGCLVALILFSAAGLSQESVDVVYLKNGDIRKGIITENVLNDHVRIQTSDGSLFTIKYDEIQKIAKETIPAAAVQETRKGLMARDFDAGLTAGVWLGGDVYISRLSGEPEKDPGLLLRLFYDEYLIEKFGVGVYVNYSSVSIEESENSLTMLEFGGAFKPRFPLAGGKAVLKIGLNIGYRMYSSDIEYVDKIRSLGINLTVEVQIQTNSGVVPFVEAGFLSQPVGGNDYADVTFPPIIYVGAGVAF